MIDKDKIPMIPCKECLMKAICKHRVRPGLLSISLRCSILDEWLKRTDLNDGSYDNSSIYASRLIIGKFQIAYEELSLTLVIPSNVI